MINLLANLKFYTSYKKISISNVNIRDCCIKNNASRSYLCRHGITYYACDV